MSEPATVETAPPAPKKSKPRRRKRPAAKIVPFKAPDEFAGMTAVDCCDGCKPDRCIISGIGLCAHPHKAPLQAALMNDPAVLERYNRAKKALAHQKIEL